MRGAAATQAAQRPAGIRRLLQDTAAVTVVATAQELAEAASSGAEHIELRTHLDLSALNVGEDTILGFLPATVKSIRVWLPMPVSSCCCML